MRRSLHKSMEHDITSVTMPCGYCGDSDNGLHVCEYCGVDACDCCIGLCEGCGGFVCAECGHPGPPYDPGCPRCLADSTQTAVL